MEIDKVQLISVREKSQVGEIRQIDSFMLGNYCLSNRKFERLGGPLDEIVTVFVHKDNVIMLRHNMTS